MLLLLFLHHVDSTLPTLHSKRSNRHPNLLHQSRSWNVPTALGQVPLQMQLSLMMGIPQGGWLLTQLLLVQVAMQHRYADGRSVGMGEGMYVSCAPHHHQQQTHDTKRRTPPPVVKTTTTAITTTTTAASTTQDLAAAANAALVSAQPPRTSVLSSTMASLVHSFSAVTRAVGAVALPRPLRRLLAGTRGWCCSGGAVVRWCCCGWVLTRTVKTERYTSFALLSPVCSSLQFLA